MPTHHKPLQVSLLSVSAHNQAILEFFFAGAGKNLFNITPIEQADAWLVDFDHPQGKNDWQQANAKLPKPAIALSVHEVDLPDVIWVPKPLTSQSLTHAAIRVRSLLSEAPQVSKENTSKAKAAELELAALINSQNERDVIKQTSRPLPQKSFGLPLNNKRIAKLPVQKASADSRKNRLINTVSLDLPPKQTGPTEQNTHPDTRQNTSLFHLDSNREPFVPETKPVAIDSPTINPVSALQEQQEQRWQTLFGDTAQLEADRRPLSERTYTAENYFLQHVLEAAHLSKETKQPIQIKVDQQDYLVLFSENGLIYSTLNIYKEPFSQLCQKPLQPGRIQLHQPNASEMYTLDKTMYSDPQNRHELEALIWTVSLLTSRGRLSRDTNPKQAVYLTHWPNLTRLEPIPHSMRIAALWHQNPNTIPQIAKQLAIPQAYAMAFYTASQTLGLISSGTENVIKRPKKATSHKNRGLFSRLLKRLLGGGRKS